MSARGLARGVRCVAGVVLLAGCLSEDVTITTEVPGASSSSGDATTTSGGETTGEEAPTTGPPPLMTTDVTTTGEPETGPAGVCGDGVQGPGEGCDDGDQDDADECPSSCVPAFCGDGFLRAEEVCDDGNKVNGDDCTNGCTAATCGDGVLHIGVEACDDGDAADDDWCTSVCTYAACGDGFVHAGHEACDDGNDVDGDDCRNDCTAPFCGDGEVFTGEECDDGDLDDTDECTSSCAAAVCGDGFLHAGVEGCDDGDDDETDECAACQPAVCGDGHVQSGVEACDDGDPMNANACSDKCVVTPTAVALTLGTPTPQFGGLRAGAAFDDACPDGQVLTGFAGELANLAHGKLGGRCRPLALAVADDEFVVHTGTPTPLPVRGSAGGDAWTRDCPQDQVVIGFSGRADGAVHRLVFTCAPLMVVESPEGAFSPAIGAGTNLVQIGGDGGVPVPQTSCPMGQVANQQRLRASAAIDAFGLGCAALSLTFD